MRPGLPIYLWLPRHRTGLDAAAEAIAHHHVVAFAPFRHELRDGGEIVAVVGVTHHDKSAARGRDSGPKCVRRNRAALTFTTRAPDCFREFRASRPSSRYRQRLLRLECRRLECICRALSMQMPSEFASFRQGMTTETSTGSAEVRSGRGMVRGAILLSTSIVSQLPIRVHRSTPNGSHGARETTDQAVCE